MSSIANNTTQAVTTNYAGARKSSLVYPNGRGVHYSYHDGGPLESISDTADHANPIVTYEYIGGRVLTKFLQNGLFLDMREENETTFDELGRPDYYDYYYIYNDADPEDEPDWQRDSTFGFSYAYDRAGNKTRQYLWPNVNDSQRYAYDSANRLTAYNRGTYAGATDPCDDLGATWSDQTIARRWALDGLGNWQSLETSDSSGATSESRLSTTFNEYSKVDGATQAHDDNGNLTFDGSQHYQWDAFNRLRVALDDSLTTIGLYSYDSGYRRIRRYAVENSEDTNTDYYYDGWRVQEERQAIGSSIPTTPIRQFIYGRYLDEQVAMDTNIDEDAFTTGVADSRRFFLQNTLYSVYGVTDTDQGIVEAYEYGPYGEHVALVDGDSDGIVNFSGSDSRVSQGGSEVGNSYGFTGRRYDPETGLIYARTRFLQPPSGDYLSRDTVSYKGGPRLSGYGRSNPTSTVDPYGRDPEKPEDTDKPEEPDPPAQPDIDIEVESPVKDSDGKQAERVKSLLQRLCKKRSEINWTPTRGPGARPFVDVDEPWEEYIGYPPSTGFPAAPPSGPQTLRRPKGVCVPIEKTKKCLDDICTNKREQRVILGGKMCNGPDGYTYGDGKIHICPEGLKTHDRRLIGTILHEIIHECGHRPARISPVKFLPRCCERLKKEEWPTNVGKNQGHLMRD